MRTAIFGAGRNGRLFLAALEASGQTVDHFIDDALAGGEVEGRAVLGRAESAARPARVFLSLLPQRDGRDGSCRHDAVRAALGALGHEVIDFVGALARVPGLLERFFESAHLWMRAESAEMLDRDGLGALRGALVDDASRDLLDRLVRWRETRAFEHYVAPSAQTEYFPDDLPWQQGLDAIRFADCGAYTGDTLCDLVASATRPVRAASCFEPDRANLGALGATARRLVAEGRLPAVNVYPCGVWSSDTVATFSSGEGSSSAIAPGGGDAAGGTTSVPLVALDTVLGAAPPNLIKLDIEGAEREALLGARGLIGEHAPRLAVCLYHRPADLWELPRLIAEMQPAYRMGLRLHGHLGLGTVLYCY